jgi:DNA-binding transcriptional MerR regulator/ubiquinone/menaquinone biosynthesis C-methylase UbiE
MTAPDTPAYLITDLARAVGLSRATLLHYERTGLFRGRRQANGYRVYTEADRQRLAMLQRLQAAGLSLAECRACLDGQRDTGLLAARLDTLEAEIAAKTRARDLVAGLPGRGSLRDWHDEIERVAPDLHRAWLMRQGFTDAEATQVALLSRDMHGHGACMADFDAVFAGLDLWGPGTPEARRRALALLPARPGAILEIGCGPGAATLQLAAETGARITATDTDTGALARLEAAAAASGHAGRITTAAQDMAALPAPDTPFDTIRAEGSAHIIGVARALALWRPLLRPGGTLVLSDMVWRSATPDPELRAFRAREYPDMADVPTRLSQARAAGYRVRGRIDPGPEALDACYTPLAARVAAMARAAVGHAGSGRPHRRTGLLAQCPWPGRLRTLRSPTPLSLPRKALLPWTSALTSPATSPPSPPCSPPPSPPPKARRRAR